jgi:hypothetical protein
VHLHLRCDVFNDALFEAVGRYCPYVRTLQFHFRNNACVTDSAVTAVAVGCPELQRLELSAEWMSAQDAAQLTNAGIHFIATHCRYIQLVVLHSPGWRDTGSWSDSVEVLLACRRFLLVTDDWGGF